MPMLRFLRSSTMLSSVVGASFIAVMSAQAADSPIVKSPPPAVGPLPAVDGINYVGAIYGGSFWEKGLVAVDGTVTVPLGPQYGFQGDVVGSSWSGRFYGEVHGHWFWRDPNVGMLGLYAAYTHLSRFGGSHAGYVGAEFARYHGPWEVKGVVGVEAGNSASGFSAPSVLTVYDRQTRFFDYLDISYYFTENMKLGIGHRYLSGKNALALRGEWAAPLGGGRMASLFVEGRVGEDDFKSIWAGLRVYFGTKDKSLIRRHREDTLTFKPHGGSQDSKIVCRDPECGIEVD